MSREEGVKQKCQEKEVPGERDAREKNTMNTGSRERRRQDKRSRRKFWSKANVAKRKQC